jgi:predicted DNA-binding protein (UPF0251 family)
VSSLPIKTDKEFEAIKLIDEKKFRFKNAALIIKT